MDDRETRENGTETAEAPASPTPAQTTPTEAAPAPAREDAAPEPTPESFAELLAESEGAPQPRWRRGEKVSARVVSIRDEWVFVSLGGKAEGTIRREEFRAPEAAEGEDDRPPLPAEGGDVEAYVFSTDGGEVMLTTKLARRDASQEALEEAWRNGIPVEGRVAKTIKGGYEVRISGARAFCPLSQIDIRWPRQPEEHLEQTYTFRILEYKERGRNIIVSRRALLEEERVKMREDLVERVAPGSEVTGTVRSIQNFGAFVDLGGVDALIPVSEMSWGRVESPADVVAEGQTVTAKVLSVDWDRDRVSLSLKAMEEDPWAGVARRYQPGQRVPGTVVRLAPFGAFVNLEPGIDGLVHISALGAGRRVGHPKEVLEIGEQVEVEILSVDPEQHRISLSLEHRLLESMGPLASPGTVVPGTVEKVMNFGVFVKLPSGHTGLVPNVEMGTPKGTDHSRDFRPGDPMDVMVLDVEEGGRRIRLSRKAVTENAEAAAVREYAPPAGGASGSLGTLGDLLKAKMEKKG